jgi:hypothetical protein
VLPWDIIDGGKASFSTRVRQEPAEEWTLPPKRQRENARQALPRRVIRFGSSRCRRFDRRHDHNRTVFFYRSTRDGRRASNPRTRGISSRIGPVRWRPRLTQQREAPSLAVDAVLPRRKRDVAPGAPSAASLPDGKADQLESIERPLGEMELGVRELARRVASVVWRNLDGHGGFSFRLFTGVPSRRVPDAWIPFVGVSCCANG